jgi:RHS repeat-associated protein
MTRIRARFARGKACSGILAALLPVAMPVLHAWDLVEIGTTEILNDVCVSGGTVFATGKNGTAISSGNGWNPMATGVIGLNPSFDFFGVWGSSGTDVYAVGGRFFDQYSQTGAVMHYDGSSWTQVCSNGYGRYRAVWGSSSSNVFAVGEKGAIHRFDGDTWINCQTDPGWDAAWNVENFQGVWGSGPTRVMVCGGASVLLFDGTAWSAMAGPAAGSAGHIYRMHNDVGVGPFGPVYACNGSTWSQVNTNIPVYGLGILGHYVVGNSGRIYYGSSGGTWSETTPFTDIEGTPSAIADGLYLAGSRGPLGAKVGAVWRGGSQGSTPPTTTATPGDGSYPYPVAVALSAQDNLGGDVGILATFYTTDGSEPDESSTSYSAPIDIGSTTTLKFFSIDNHSNREAVRSATYAMLSPDPSLLGGPKGLPHTVFAAGEEVAAEIGLPRHTVNTATLNLVLIGTLCRARSAGPTVHLTLTHNSAAPAGAGMFGPGWRSTYEASITLASDGFTANVAKGSGQILAFVSPVDLNDPGTVYPVILNAPEACLDTLTCTETAWIYTVKASRHAYTYARRDASLPGRLTTVTDRNGNEVAIAVDQETGIIASVTDPAGRTMAFITDGEGRCTRVNVPTGGGDSLSFTYDADGWLASITDMAGYTGRYTYDDGGRIVRAVTDGRSATFTYEQSGGAVGTHLAKVYDNQTYDTRYAFVPDGRDAFRVRRISRGGKAHYFSANEKGKTTELVDPLAHVRAIGYENQLPTSYTDGLGKITRHEYDARGNVTRATDALSHNYDFTYDADDNLLTRTNPLGQTWTYTYDARGNVTAMTPPTGPGTQLTYHANGTIETIRDPNGNTTAFSYDAKGNLIRTTDPLGGETVLAYDSAGLLCTAITDPRGKEKRLTYDRNQRLAKAVQQSHPLQPERRLTFDAFAQTELYDELGGRTIAARDGFGHITRLTPPLGSAFAETFEYDAEHNLLRQTNPLGQASTFTYDDASRLERATDPRGQIVRREYDDEGNLTRITDERGGQISFTYDDNNRLLTEAYPVIGTLATTRDQLGRVATTTNRRGNTVTYAYDSRGRRTGKTVTGDGGGIYSYTYDDNGNLLTHSIGGTTNTYTYDAMSRVATITYPDGHAVAFTYDAAGNIASTTYPNALTVTYTYDDFNRLPLPASFRNGAKTEIPGAEKPTQATRIEWAGRIFLCTYDNAGNPKLETRPNGSTTAYAYDASQRLTGVVHANPAATLPSLTYTLDRAGRTVGVANTRPMLPAIPAAATAAYNAGNQTTAFGGVAYSHDADGNLTGTGDGRLAATYDPQNRPLTVTRLGETLTCAYDANGERLNRVDDDGTRTFHYDHRGRLLFETDAGNAVTSCYIYLGRKPIAMGTAAAGFRHFHYDRTGNTIALTDDDGALVVAYAHLPYGGTVASADGIHNPFTFHGAWGVMDEGGGLYFMKNRWYDAVTGRFLQRDPIGHQGGLNLYRFANGNPVDHIDPEGTIVLSSLLVGTAFVATAAAGSYTLYKYFRGHEEREDMQKVADAHREQQGDVYQRVAEGKSGAIPVANNVNKQRQKDNLNELSAHGEVAGELVKDAYQGVILQGAPKVDAAIDASEIIYQQLNPDPSE